MIFEFILDYVVLLECNFIEVCIFYGAKLGLELHQSSTANISKIVPC